MLGAKETCMVCSCKIFEDPTGLIRICTNAEDVVVSVMLPTTVTDIVPGPLLDSRRIGFPSAVASIVYVPVMVAVVLILPPDLVLEYKSAGRGFTQHGDKTTGHIRMG